ncbi:Transposase family Tnp2 protein [Ceratobasidium sp. AG-Ba]|nr:Transposase family Tnp2 protein [Ceratobasidium sp. AG-Ba]
MDVDGPHQNTELAPALPKPKKRCFCCGKRYGTRQLARHLKLYLQQLDEEIAAAQANGQLDDMDEDEDGPQPEGHDMDIDAAEMGAEDVMEDLGNAQLPANVGAGDVGPDIGDAEDPMPLFAAPEYTHGLIDNPPIHIDNWPDPDLDPDVDGEGSSVGDEPVQDDDGDPPFEELPDQADHSIMDSLFEPDMTADEVRAVMDLEYGDLAEQEWLDLYDKTLSRKDKNTFGFLAARLRTHFSRQTYDELRYGVCEPLHIPSEFVAYRRLRIAAGLETRRYDCCVKSCCCFLGKHRECQICPYCKEPRYTAGGRPRRYFYYTPLIPQLQALFRSPDMLDKLCYRSRVENASDPGVYEDVYDGKHYRTLRNTKLDQHSGYKILDNPEDLALGLSTDGFTLFKRRRRIAQCKDLNSFLAPALEELLLLERGVLSTKAVPTEGHPGHTVEFLLPLKGHNAKVPCRTCYVQGYLCKLPKNSVYYVPLTYPGEEEGFPPERLLMRTHNGFLQHYDALDNLADRPGRRKKYAQDFGVNDRPIFARLASFDLAKCAPYDIMHLFFENLVPNMIKHWIGKFKKLDQGTGNYTLHENVWNEIGRLTAEATCTIPAAFVGTLPDIAEDRTLYKAEAYSFWIQYIAPIVLRNRLPEPYYEHFLLMRDIIILSVQLNITSEQIDELEAMVNRWVTDYEKYYYQYEYDRLPACPLTIHALLHIPYYIRMTGPLWASWAFVMERFCGYLLPAVKNRYQPYRHLDNYIMRTAQLKVVCHTYGLPVLARSTVKWRYEGGERMSTREVRYPEFPEVILGTPIKRNVQLDTQLTNQLTKFLGVIHNEFTTGAQLRERIDAQSIVSYGRFRMIDDGDRIRTASVVETTKRATGNVRDNSYVRFTALPDLNADNSGPDIAYEEVNYGQLIGIYYFEFITDLATNTRKPYLVARIMSCDGTGFLDAALPENPLVTYRRLKTPDIFDIRLIDAVIGRIKLPRNEWAIIDCSRNGARTQFTNNDDDD